LIRYEDIQERVERSRPDADVDFLRRAYVYSALAHRGQLRRSGEPYLVHPLEVAFILADLGLDVATVATGLLHDAVEDSHVTVEDVAEKFGMEVAALVNGVTKLSRINMVSEAERQAENIRKMILAMVEDIRVILVKLADRLHNMRTLRFMPEEKQRRIAKETMEIYVPLANRLGLGRIRQELEDLAFEYSGPANYRNLIRRVDEKRAVSDSLIAQVRERLAGQMVSHAIKAEITGRVKSIYSIYRKMQVQMIDVDQVYDIVAFRIITESVKDCYGALGIVHSMWPPVPGRIKDFIAMPKPNLYQSLHTTVMSEQGAPFEVQIRTWEMHRLAEEGIAAHWQYKEKGQMNDRELAGVQWLRQVMDWQKDVGDSREFLKYVKVDLYPGEVYVFTPKGRVINLARGSTPLDFAYAIHSEVGNQCVGARVNGRLVPLKTELKNGDIIEIVTQAGHQPSRDWLAVARTTRARSKIRAFLKSVERERSLELGKSLLEKEARRFGLSLKGLADEKRNAALAEMKYETLDELYVALGHGKVTPHQFLSLVAPEKELEEEKPSIFHRATRLFSRKGEKVLVRGVGDTLIKLARCCNPIPGDAIIGYITRGKGVSVHTEDCPNLESLLVDTDRRIDVEWAPDQESTSFHVGVWVLTENRPGMLARVAELLEREKINIRHADAGVDEQQRGTISLVAEVGNRGQIERLVDRIRRIDGVYQVRRVSPARAAGQTR
jgi:GTP pyrophosphokinase